MLMAQYPNAPITEAVFDIRIDQVDPSLVNRLKNIPGHLRSMYPQEKNRPGMNFSFAIAGAKIKNFEKTEPTDLGYIFSNSSNTRMFQFRLDGFTFNILKPYSNWEEFSKEAFRIWQLYKDIIPHLNITRLGLRYINRINIPTPVKSFQEYVTYIPPVPDSLPKILNRFFMQVEIPKDDINVVLTETMEPIISNKLPFILDIDCIKNIEKPITHEELTRFFNTMRDTKNSVFESCITDKSRQLFK